MISDEVTLYSRRTLGPSRTLAVDHLGVVFEFPSQGRWEIHNTGTDPCAILMTKGTAIKVTYAGDKLLPTIAAAESLSLTHVDIGMDDVKVHSKSPAFLQAITSGAGVTTTLRLTRVTKR